MRLVADGNVLLSAVIGGRTKTVLVHPSITEIFTAEVTLAEVQEYAAQLATKKRLARDIVLLAVASLPVSVVGRATYEKSIPEAKRRIGRRDLDDVGPELPVLRPEHVQAQASAGARAALKGDDLILCRSPVTCEATLTN